MCSAISALRSARGTLIVCKLVRSRSTTVRPSVRDGLSQRKEEKEGGSWRLCMRWRTRGLASDRVLVQRSAGSGALQSARDAGQATQGSIISTYIHTYLCTSRPTDLGGAALAVQTPVRSGQPRPMLCYLHVQRGATCRGGFQGSLLVVCGQKRKAGGVVEDAQPTRIVRLIISCRWRRPHYRQAYIHSTWR